MSTSVLQDAVRKLGPERLMELLTPEQRARVRFLWRAQARPEQIAPPGKWSKWLVLAGRGFGKTRTGSEWTREKAQEMPGCRWALVARTAADVRDVVVEGESGILATSPPDFRPTYEPSKRRLTWPNGFQATTYSADKPDQLRGPQHHGAWADELAAWKNPDTWDQLQFGLRLGTNPQALATTTPRPVRVIRELIADPDCHVTRGSTYDNAANLPAAFFKQLVGRYEGTRLGRQELLAEVLDDIPGALWTRAMFEHHRVTKAQVPQLVRVVVSVDPAVTSGEDSDMTGIIVAGLSAAGHVYVLADLTCQESPETWARRVIQAYRTFEADRVVAEVNNGGDLVQAVLRSVDPSIPFKAVRAARGKRVRAEPVAALYEQGFVHHVGTLTDLEDQACQFTPDGFDGSPDRVDALVYAARELVPAVDVPPQQEEARAMDDEIERKLLRALEEQEEAQRNGAEWAPTDEEWTG